MLTATQPEEDHQKYVRFSKILKLKLKLITFGIAHHMNAGHFQVCLTVRTIEIEITYSFMMSILICKLSHSC